jgi:hypothetical protein
MEMWVGLAVLPVCGLAGWWLFLRLARHVYDRGGAADLWVLAELAQRYRHRYPPEFHSPPELSNAPDDATAGGQQA